MSDNNQATDTVVNRIFIYGDHTFADPGPGYTAEQVHAHLDAY